MAIAAAAEARREWSSWPWEDRAAVLLRAAELLATTWRATVNAATMLGQSKTVYPVRDRRGVRADRFLALQRLLRAGALPRAADERPGRVEPARVPPLEGFVYAVSPFNFTAIGGNLTTAPALMGEHGRSGSRRRAAMLSALLHAASCSRRPGCRRASSTSCPAIRRRSPTRLLDSPDLAGIHFTGSTEVFHSMWKTRRREHRQLPNLSAPRRRDRRQGLHRRAPVGGSPGGRGGDRARRLRVSGPEVLGGEPHLHPAVALEGRARPHRRDDEGHQDRRRARLPQLHGRGHRQEGVHAASASTSTTRRRTRRSSQGGVARGETGYFIEPTLVETDRSRVSPALRGDLRTGRHRVRLSGREVGGHARASSTGRRPTR